MGTRKYEAFNWWTTMMADFFRVALSHPCRITLISLLLIHGSRTVGELTQDIPELSQSSLSEHVRILRESGFIVGDQKGTRIYYRLEPGAMDMLRVFLEFCVSDENFISLLNFDRNNNLN